MARIKHRWKYSAAFIGRCAGLQTLSFEQDICYMGEKHDTKLAERLRFHKQ